MAQARLDRALIRVSGPDAHTFLQGLLTQNVDRLGQERIVYAGLLTPQGKVMADMFLWAEPENAVIIDAAAGRGEDLLRRLALYKLRANVTIEPHTGASVVVSGSTFEGAVADPRLGDLGSRALLAADAAQSIPSDAHAYTARRIALGVPDLAVDAEPEEVFALEALFEELNGVDFQKGCFVGQENVSRMKRRATTRKKFCPITHNGPAFAPGARVRAGEVDLGEVRSALPGRALALIRLDRAAEAEKKGIALEVGGQAVRLAAPSWLGLPDSA